MSGGEAEQQLLAGIVKTETEVEGRTRKVGRRECGVRTVGKVGLAAFYRLRQQVSLRSEGEHAAPQLQVVGILHGETLLREEAEHIVHEHRSHTVARLPELKRHVHTGIHRRTGIFETRGMGLEGGVDGELGGTSHCCRTPLGFHLPVLLESGILLGLGGKGHTDSHRQHNDGNTQKFRNSEAVHLFFHLFFPIGRALTANFFEGRYC